MQLKMHTACKKVLLQRHQKIFVRETFGGSGLTQVNK